MTRNDTELLIQKYLNGETTVEEERQLALEVSREDVPEDWKIIAGMLAAMMAVIMVLSVGCKKTADNTDVKDDAVRNFATAKVYSMDLTSIDGYTDKVENGTWAETYDKLIDYVKKESDTNKRFALMHKAEDLLMSTGDIVPLYYYTDLYMIKPGITGFYSSPLGYKFFQKTTVNGSNENINVNLASEPDTIDPALNSAVDGATIISHCFSGLYRWAQTSDGALYLEEDCASGYVKATNPDGSVTYVITLKAGLKWSDGSALKASDFKRSWDRAISEELGADYEYMFEVIDGYDKGELNVKADDVLGTLTVTLPVDVAYFIELLAFPTYFPVPATADKEGTWATSVDTYVSNGAYKLTSWDHNSKMVFEKNDQYWDAENITMKKITNFLADDDTAILAAYNAGTYDFIDSVPNDEIENLKKTKADELVIAGQLGTYYVIFNNNANLLPGAYTKGKTDAEVANAMKEVRQALSLLIDRNYICEEIGQAGQEPAASFVALGLTDADGKTEFYKNANKQADGSYGYYSVKKDDLASNRAKAVEILKKYYAFDEKTGKFTNFPAMTYLYNTSSGHQAIGEYIQGVFAVYGITMNLENQEWGTFLDTRKKGDFTIARNGWLGDYNDPISFLDMWTTKSGNNDAQFGK